MAFHVDLDVRGFNSSVKDTNDWTTYKGDFLIVVKTYAERAPLLQ